jgi:DNA (cytosine-5)-methyltransferase 1
MDQLSIFDFITEDKPLPTDIKLLSLFSGIGAFEKALDRLGINYELVNYCEIDKHASRSYSAIHNVSEELNLWDVTKVDEKALPKDIDLLTYGFPCQDISLAGKQKGLFNEDGTKTRSGLFFDALRIIEETQPKVAIAENVKNLVGKKFSEQFKIVLDSLESAGYNNYYQVLNAKDYGIPQNRERVFIISIRKDIDNGMFEFPKGFPLEKRLKDVLEDTVDEKYYLSGKMVDYLATITEKNKARGNGNVYSPSDVDGVSKTITTKEGSRVKDNFIEEPAIYQIGQIYPNSGNPQAGRIYDAEGISPTIDTCSGGNRMMPKVAVLQLPRGKNKGGIKEISPTLTSNAWEQNNFCTEQQISGGLRIRKLTPKECFRLMGFDDSDFHKAELVNSNTQLYKQAGNSIVVDVLEYILKQIFKAI